MTEGGLALQVIMGSAKNVEETMRRVGVSETLIATQLHQAQSEHRRFGPTKDPAATNGANVILGYIREAGTVLTAEEEQAVREDLVAYFRSQLGIDDLDLSGELGVAKAAMEKAGMPEDLIMNQLVHVAREHLLHGRLSTGDAIYKAHEVIEYVTSAGYPVSVDDATKITTAIGRYYTEPTQED